MIAYNRVDGDEGWRQDVDSLEETLGTLGIEERVCNTMYAHCGYRSIKHVEGEVEGWKLV